MRMMKMLLVVAGLISAPLVAMAHPGNTDTSGCHTCRTNCPKWGLSTGEYHCHRSKGVPQPEASIRSHSDGTTELWPEYNTPKTTSYPSVVTKLPLLGSGTASTITSTLSRGMENTQVLKLQQVLAKYPEIYPEGSVTGYFGPATERAVKRFQKKYGLEQVGVVGPKTRTLLNTL